MYKIKLEQFEGPLDLLLFFIKRDELNIYDIPISKITKEFLEYVNLIKLLDLEVAGDFILMASTLMHIKVRMLLPPGVDEKGEEIDPRGELVQALLEYKRYKEMSEELAFFETSQRKLNFRSNYSEDPAEAPPEYEVLLKNVSIFDLAKAFKKALEGVKQPVVHEVMKINISIDEQIEYILKLLDENKRIHFLTLVNPMRERIRIVITFIALLELVKMQRIGIEGSDNSVINALIFASDEPLPAADIMKAIKGIDGEDIQINVEDVNQCVEEINNFYDENQFSFKIIKVANGFLYATRPEVAKYVGFLSSEKSKRRLSQAALETLAIIAYKQPLTKPELETIRGVNSDYILNTLLEKRLITITGRAETIGRPLLYNTTDEFLKYFGLNKISDLPKPREIDEIMQDEDFIEQKKRIMMNLIEEKIEDEMNSGGDDGSTAE